MKGRIAVLGLLVLTAGCATAPTGRWVKEGTTGQQQKVDLYQCHRDAAMANFNGSESGGFTITMGGQNSPAARMLRQSYPAQARAQLFSECMGAHGYHFEEGQK